MFCVGRVNKEVNFTHLKQLLNIRLRGSSWELEQDSESSGGKPHEFCGNTFGEIYIRVLIVAHFVLNSP